MGNHNMGEHRFMDALDLAKGQNLDLVQVAVGKKGVPVCRIIDYGKFCYEQSKKTKVNKQKQVDWKEIRLTPGIAKHDVETKLKQIRQFLEQGKHIKVMIKYKRRQIVHIDEGRKVMSQILAAIEDIGKVESNPRMEGKQLSTQIVPK